MQIDSGANAPLTNIKVITGAVLIIPMQVKGSAVQY